VNMVHGFSLTGGQVVAGSNPVSPTQFSGYFVCELGTILGPVPKRSTQTRFQRRSTSKELGGIDNAQ
jgi:hypothetical protein